MAMPTQIQTTGVISNTGLLLLHPLGVGFVFTHPSLVMRPDICVMVLNVQVKVDNYTLFFFD